MKKEDIPFYNDPDEFNESSTYPCDTQYMEYNPMLHRYILTDAGLNKYGVQLQRYITNNPNKSQELRELASKKIYDYIQYKSGQCYQVQMYRMATAPTVIYPDQYYMRKQIEEILASQAKFICENGDGARYSKSNMENPQTPLSPEETFRDSSDVSPEAIRTLESLGLTRWFNIGSYRLDSSKY